VNVLDFQNKFCKNNHHALCDGAWTGLGFEILCICKCHNEVKKHAREELEEPISLATGLAMHGIKAHD
jgi:hypothetical protein